MEEVELGEKMNIFGFESIIQIMGTRKESSFNPLE